MKTELQKDAAGKQVYNADGSPRMHYTYDGPEGGGLVLTGPDAKGLVVVPDGTTYDVTPEVIQHDVPGHGEHIAEAIRQQHVAAGRLPA